MRARRRRGERRWAGAAGHGQRPDERRQQLGRWQGWAVELQSCPLSTATPVCHLNTRPLCCVGEGEAANIPSARPVARPHSHRPPAADRPAPQHGRGRGGPDPERHAGPGAAAQEGQAQGAGLCGQDWWSSCSRTDCQAAFGCSCGVRWGQSGPGAARCAALCCALLPCWGSWRRIRRACWKLHVQSAPTLCCAESRLPRTDAIPAGQGVGQWPERRARAAAARRVREVRRRARARAAAGLHPLPQGLAPLLPGAAHGCAAVGRLGLPRLPRPGCAAAVRGGTGWVAVGSAACCSPLLLLPRGGTEPPCLL